jgi:GTP-binding protein HflX
LFATLDPSSRRLRFPKNVEVIITDTVGFIKNLPKDLMAAFRATLEELEGADILLHVIDIGNSRFNDQIESVNKILDDLNLHDIPLINVLNKMDLVDTETVEKYCERLQGLAISALNKTSLIPLTRTIENMVKKMHDGNR